MKLNDKIYYCRKKLGISQEEFAEKIGVTRQAVSKWETGMAVPEIDKLVALAKAFGVTTDWLLSEDEPAESTSSQNSSKGSSQSSSTYGTGGSNPYHPNYRGTQATSPYPEWMEKAPAFLQKLLKRFGWLFGVYVTVVGALFMGFGGLMKVFTSFFFSATSSTEIITEDIISGFPSSGVIIGEFMQDPVIEIVKHNPVSIIANIVLIVGAAITICGIVLIFVLRKYAKQ